MDDFLNLPERHAGYPITLAEARGQLHRGRWSAKDWHLLSADERALDLKRAGMFLRWKLSNSELHSFAQAPDSGAWYRIPAGYWLEHRSGIPAALKEIMGGVLPTHVERRPYLRAVPAEIVGAPIAVWREDIVRLTESLAADAEGIAEAVTELVGRIDAIADADAGAADTAPSKPDYSTSDRPGLVREVALTLDRQGKSIRDVKARDVDALWPKGAGPRPPVTRVQQFMAGGKRGRPARGS